ncbi:MAG: TolC family protein [Phycisphaerae bacterium]|nr:TolC family protein [Phycisphaerae bacterium]
MIRNIYISIVLCLGALGLTGLCVVGGCALEPEKVKSEADEDVYGIVDKKWDEKFGIRTNYRISDTEASANALRVEKAVPKSGTLNIAEAVALATAHNRPYQTEKEAIYLKALDLRLIRHSYEPNLFALGSIDAIRDGEDGAIGGEAAFGFQQLLATGGMISTQVALGWIDILSGDVRSGMTSILTAAVRVPLLRGSGRAIALEQLTQAERDTLYQIRIFNRFRKTFVVDVISQYYRLLELYNIMENAEANYRVLGTFYERMAPLNEAGKLPRHELQQAHQDRLLALDLYVQARNEYEKALDLFKITLGLPTATAMALDTAELTALVAHGVPTVNFNEEDAISTALRTRLDLANVADMVIDTERKVTVAEDGLRAQLDLIGVARPNFSDQMHFGAGSGQLRDAEDRYMLSAKLDLPLDRMAEKTAYRKALIALIQQRRAHEEATDQVVLAVRQAYRKLKEARERYLVQSHATTLAQQRVDNTFLLLQYSSAQNRRASVRDVLDAQKDLFRAQNDATDALVDYNIALLEFYRDAGVLQVKPDGMWQTVAAAE